MLNVESREHLQSELTAAADADALAAVSFFSPECFACRSMQPKLRQIARGAAPGSLVFLKVDGSREGLRQIMEAEGIDKIPFFRLYRGGVLVAEFTANMQPEKLKLLRDSLSAHSPSGSHSGGSGGDEPAAGGGGGAGKVASR